MQDIKLNIVNFWDGLLPSEWCNALGFLTDRKIEPSTEPNVLFYSVFGDSHSIEDGLQKAHSLGITPTKDCIHIFYTAEDVDMPLGYDFTIGFRRTAAKNYYRMPNYTFRRLYGIDLSKLVKDPDEAEKAADRAEFGCYVQRYTYQVRSTFVARLLGARTLFCPGRSYNNTGEIGNGSKAKIEYLSKHRFNVSMENRLGAGPNRGYVTEKLPEAMLAGCMPIYWGDPDVGLDFNPASFVILKDGSNHEIRNTINEVLSLDENRDLLRAKLREPWLHGNVLPHWMTEQYMVESFSEMFSRI